MKIKPEHYAYLRDAMRAAQAKQPDKTRAAYEAARIGNDPAKRHRWDLSYAAGLFSWIAENIYPYADDGHLDTAFKAIVKEMESEGQ